MVHDILQEVSHKECSFKEAITKCNDVKLLQKIQTAFIKATNCESWDETVEKYPSFTTAEKLEAFKNLDILSAYKKKNHNKLSMKSMTRISLLAMKNH